MQIPGEALLGKLWETLTDKAIGNLLKPWQIRREGRAHLEVKRDELLILAQAERDAEAIRRGTVVLPVARDDHQLLLPDGSTSNEPASRPGVATDGGNDATYSAVARAVHADNVRQEINVAKAILHAEAALESDAQAPNSDSPTDDWMYRWRDYASSVSSEELQLLWGRVLAGEVKKPGAFSVRFLNFLHNLDKNEAQLIATAMPFVISDFICSEPKALLESAGLNFANLLLLQELGLLNGVEGLGLSKQFSPQAGQKMRVLLRSHELGLGLEAHECTTSIEIPAYVVTSLGQQLSRLGSFQADLPYLEAVGLHIKSKGFNVQIGRPLEFPDGAIRLLQARTL